MKQVNFETICIYCGIADGEIQWTIKQEIRHLLGGTVYPCLSKSCSGYTKSRCSSYGKAKECLALSKQAEQIAYERVIKTNNPLR